MAGRLRVRTRGSLVLELLHRDQPDRLRPLDSLWALREREGRAARPPAPAVAACMTYLTIERAVKAYVSPHEKRSRRSHEESHRRPDAGAPADARGRGGKTGVGVPGHGAGSASSQLRRKQRDTRPAPPHALDHTS